MDKIGAILLGAKDDPHRHYFDSEIEEMAHVAGLLRSEMTIGVLPNPTGAGYYNAVSYGNYHSEFEILSTVSGNTPVGTLMEVVTPYTGPGTSNPPTLVNIQPSSTTADNKLLGPVVGGSTGRLANAATSIPPGSTATILRLGIAQILCDATTTAGSLLIQSAATAGAAKTASGVLGQTIGTALQAVTISSGTALVWADICKM
jgi:hypothetical protein